MNIPNRNAAIKITVMDLASNNRETKQLTRVEV
jgi:hypothetical protein